jgi:hypothetical protein
MRKIFTKIRNGQVEPKELLDFPDQGERFVAFFEIMGFKKMIENGPNNGSLYYRFKNLIDMAENDQSGHLPLKMLKDHKYDNLSTGIIFSDTILIFTRGSTIEDAEKILMDSYAFIRYGIAMSIPINAAIAFGDIRLGFRERIFVGQPIVDAYILQNNLFLYGAALHRSALSKFQDSEFKESEIINNWLFQHKSPRRNKSKLRNFYEWVFAIH